MSCRHCKMIGIILMAQISNFERSNIWVCMLDSNRFLKKHTSWLPDNVRTPKWCPFKNKSKDDIIKDLLKEKYERIKNEKI